MVIRYATLALLVFCRSMSSAQEVKFINLTDIEQRTELRFPPAPPSVNGVGGGYSSVGIGDGAPDFRDPHALGVYLLHVSPSEVDPAQPFEAEFKVVNTGRAPIDVPVWPHLSDLQPGDALAVFSYFSIALSITVKEGPGSNGYVELYGATGHEGTMLTLEPGEWIRVKANVKFGTPPAVSDTSTLQGASGCE